MTSIPTPFRVAVPMLFLFVFALPGQALAVTGASAPIMSSTTSLPGPMKVTTLKSTFVAGENVVIYWTPSKNATKYSLAIWKESLGNKKQVVFNQYVTGNSKKVGVLSPGNYRIVMRPYGKTGRGAYTKVARFKVTSAVTTTVSAPAVASVDQAKELYNLVMEYRKEKGLRSIPVSPALTKVAQTHLKDLEANPPSSFTGTGSGPSGACNGHSWSDDGPWTSCCYTPDHAQAQCMWDKPRELTSYQGNGFEIAHGGGGSVTPSSALKGWKSSSGHNAVIINSGVWKDHPWGAIGVALSDRFAAIWFGEEKDTTGK